MDLLKYQVEAARTHAELPDHHKNTAHMFYGMVGEIEELLTAKDAVNAGEELADQMWYVSNYCTINGIRLCDIYTFKVKRNTDTKKHSEWAKTVSVVELVKVYSKFADFEKKELAYGKTFEKSKKEAFVQMIMKALDMCFEIYGIDPSIALQKNIDKLFVRYPEKFTKELALNRNLANERKVLE